MDKEYKKWFIAKRAKAMAMILMTRRDDLDIHEMEDENGLDFIIYINAKNTPGKRQFGIYMAATMDPLTAEKANKRLKPILKQIQSIGPFQFPVCVFYYDVKGNQGFYAWAYEPVLTDDGEPRLPARVKAECHELENDGLEEIVSRVNSWHEAFYATMAS